MNPSSQSKTSSSSTSSTSSSANILPIQRRSSTPLPGISATAESLREKKQRAKLDSTSSNSIPSATSTSSIKPSPLRRSRSEERRALLQEDEEEDEDDEEDEEEDGDADGHDDALRELSTGIIMPGMTGNVGGSGSQSTGLGMSRRSNDPLKLAQPKKVKSSSSPSSNAGSGNQPHQQIQLRQQINYAQQQLKSQQQKFSGAGKSSSGGGGGGSSSQQSKNSGNGKSSSKDSDKKPQSAGYNYKGTPSRSTRYSLPVRAEKPVRTSKTTGKHVVLPSESQLAPLPDEEEEEESESETDDSEEEEEGVSKSSTVTKESPSTPTKKSSAKDKEKASHPAVKLSKQPSSLIMPSQSHARAPPRIPKSSGPAYHTFERLNPPSRISTALPRLTSYALGTALHLPTLIGFLRREHGVKPRLYDECAYVVYFKPLLPGFGRANVRSAPEPRSGRSPGGESRRERMMEEQEDGGYDGGYFAAAPEEEEELDPDGYVKHERRNSSGDVKEEGLPSDGAIRESNQDEGKTDNEGTETETETESRRRRDSKDGGESELEGTSDIDGDDEDGRLERRMRNYNEVENATDNEAEGIYNKPFTIDGQQETEPLEEDGTILSTPKAKPTSTDSTLDAALDEEIKSGLDLGLSGAEVPISMSSPSGSSPEQIFNENLAGKGKRRSTSESSSISGEMGLMSGDDEPLNADRAGARDMLLQQDEEEINRSVIQAGASLAEETAQDVMDAEARGDDREMDGENNGPTSSTSNEAWRRELGQEEGKEGSRTPGGSSRWNSNSTNQENRKTRSRRVKKSRKSSGPNLASHNHDGSTNFLTSRSILEALQVAELIILPYGVLVMYNFSLAEERAIVDDVISSGCVRGALKADDEETEAFHFCYDPSVPAPRIFNDFFTFRSSNHLLKLSLAHAIAQSTKLSVFEESMQKTLELTSHIPKELASSGELALKRREALRLTGRLFKLRVDVNLTSNVLDTPELFWSEASLKALYDAIREYLEIDQRVENLNERLAVANDLLEIIHEHIANEAMSKITWVVICLIVVACVVACGEISARLVLHARNGEAVVAARAATRMMAQGARGTDGVQIPWDL